MIALYCGLAPAPAAREMIDRLIGQPDTLALSTVLAEAYLSAGFELFQDHKFRQRVLERIAIAPGAVRSQLERFPADEVSAIANLFVGKIESEPGVSEAHHWLRDNPELMDKESLTKRLREWSAMNPFQLAELIHLLHRYGSDAVLTEMASDAEMYAAPGPRFGLREIYSSQAEIALLGLSFRESEKTLNLPGVDRAFLQILRVLVNSRKIANDAVLRGNRFLMGRSKLRPPQNPGTWSEFASLARQLAERLISVKDPLADREGVIEALNLWADALERAIAKRAKQQTRPKSKPKSKATTSRTKKKRTGRGKRL